MKWKIFVDGRSGTTGLKIHERLAHHPYVELLAIPEEKRKDLEMRRAFLNEADLAFLCLPDSAAREAAAMALAKARLIDASTAHRIAPGWVYGLPELGAAWRNKIAGAGRVSVPGCHATGFVLAVHPLVTLGILPPDAPVTCHSLTGYSGGGKDLIGAYQAKSRDEACRAPRHYALGLQHKHLPEMQQWAGLTRAPFFTPVVGDFYQGMAVAVPLFASSLAKKLAAPEIRTALADFYAGQRFVRVMPYGVEAEMPGGFFNPLACNGTNHAEIFVCGREDQILILTRLDNLGKGSSGAAVQIMNIMMGIDEGTALG